MANVQSVERALTLLNVLSEYPDGIQVTRLSEQVGLTKSTTHRLLTTLVNMNYVLKDKDSDKYKLGYQVVYLSRQLLNNSDLIQVSRPYLKKLCDDVNEAIHLCIEDNEEVLYIDKLESTQTIRMYSRIGNRRPFYCTGVGKVLLAGMESERYKQILQNIDFEVRTPNTITTPEKLTEEVRRVKELGYALDNVEVEEGIRCIAAPIYNAKGNIIASFSISGPSNRVTLERIKDELIERVRQTTREISEQLKLWNT